MTHNAVLTDREIVGAILSRDRKITTEYMYRRYMPLFKSVYQKYYTDCSSEIEFVNEIYLYILTPREDTGMCKLDSFGFKCSFPMWLKIVCENYCRHLFSKKIEYNENIEVGSDRLDLQSDSLVHDMSEEINSLDLQDLQTVLASMPNKRYSSIIRLRYLEGKTNEETALALDMNMANFYNKHKLAKAQFCEALRKEGLI